MWMNDELHNIYAMISGSKYKGNECQEMDGYKIMSRI